MTADGRAGGFTLIEVLVAFVILALALGGFLRVFSTGLGSAQAGEAYALASLIADSTLEAVGVEHALEPGELEGQVDDRFRWRIEIAPYVVSLEEPGERSALGSAFEDSAFELEDDEAAEPRLFRVSVSVEWDAEDAPRSIRLSTLRLAPPES